MISQTPPAARARRSWFALCSNPSLRPWLQNEAPRPKRPAPGKKTENETRPHTRMPEPSPAHRHQGGKQHPHPRWEAARAQVQRVGPLGLPVDGRRARGGAGILRRHRRGKSPSRLESDRPLDPGNAGRRYASITGDYNPIHISPLAARLFGFPQDLVHGMWGVARASAGLKELQTENPVRADVSFKGPLYIGKQVRVNGISTSDGRKLKIFCGSELRPAVLVSLREVNKMSKPLNCPPD